MVDRLFRQQGESIFSLGVDEVAKAHLLETARWTRFLAVLYLIVTGLLLIGGILTAFAIGNSANNAITAAGIGIGMVLVYVLFIAIYFYPVWALYKFSRLMKESLQIANQQQFNEALKYQKNMFKYLGVLVIVLLSVYGISIVFMLIGVVFSNL